MEHLLRFHYGWLLFLNELLGGSLFGIFESQGGRTTPRDPPPNSMYAQNARFSTKITNFSPHKNPSGLVGFHCRVRVFLGFSSKVGFGFWVLEKIVKVGFLLDLA